MNNDDLDQAFQRELDELRRKHMKDHNVDYVTSRELDELKRQHEEDDDVNVEYLTHDELTAIEPAMEVYEQLHTTLPIDCVFELPSGTVLVLRDSRGNHYPWSNHD
jgi:rhamnose utilization protein RhaD (predicted bifunctional aldolase and dehydrogenase)